MGQETIHAGQSPGEEARRFPTWGIEGNSKTPPVASARAVKQTHSYCPY